MSNKIKSFSKIIDFLEIHQSLNEIKMEVRTNKNRKIYCQQSVPIFVFLIYVPSFDLISNFQIVYVQKITLFFCIFTSH